MSDHFRQPAKVTRFKPDVFPPVMEYLHATECGGFEWKEGKATAHVFPDVTQAWKIAGEHDGLAVLCHTSRESHERRDENLAAKVDAHEAPPARREPKPIPQRIKENRDARKKWNRPPRDPGEVFEETERRFH